MAKKEIIYKPSCNSLLFTKDDMLFRKYYQASIVLCFFIILVRAKVV